MNFFGLGDEMSFLIRFIFKIILPKRIWDKFQKKLLRKKGLKFGSNVFLEKTFAIQNNYNLPIIIGNDCILGCNLVYESNHGSIKIGNRCFINANTQIISRDSVEIGDDVTIAWNCTIYDHNSHSLDWKERQKDLFAELDCLKNGLDFIQNKNWNTVKSRPIKICDKAWLGFGVTVLNGVTIGEGAIIGAQSVVREDIPPYSIAYGNPARVVKYIKSE